jgi:hypothetical protein
MTLRQVMPLDNHLLYIETSQGTEGVFDVKPFLAAEAFAPLQDSAEFAAVHNGGYFVEWPCGADLSADTITARMSSGSPKNAQLGRQPDRQLASLNVSSP